MDMANERNPARELSFKRPNVVRRFPAGLCHAVAPLLKLSVGTGLSAIVNDRADPLELISRDVGPSVDDDARDDLPAVASDDRQLPLVDAEPFLNDDLLQKRDQ